MDEVLEFSMIKAFHICSQDDDVGVAYHF